MKYMLVMRATDEAFASMANADFAQMIETVGKFNDELIRAGVLLAAEGLSDAAEGVVVDFSSEPPVVTDGPYGETKELFGGFLPPQRGVEGGGRRMGQAAADHRPRFQDRDSADHHHRRVSAGQPVDQEGAGVARGHRPIVSLPALSGAAADA